MINVIEANRKMLINRKSNDLMDKIEQRVEKAISNGYCRTDIDLDSDLDKEIIDTLYEKLIGLGYRVEYIPTKPSDQWDFASYLRIDWSLEKGETE